jgi:hypothetical protein
MKLCPYCDKEIEPATPVCPHCGRDWKSGVSHLNAGAPYDAGRSSPFLTQGQTIAAVYLLVAAVGLVASSGPPREMPSRFAFPIVIYLTMPLSFVISVNLFSLCMVIDPWSVGRTVARDVSDFGVNQCFLNSVGSRSIERR